MGKLFKFRVCQDGRWDVVGEKPVPKKKPTKKDLERTIQFLEAYAEFCEKDEQETRQAMFINNEL